MFRSRWFPAWRLARTPRARVGVQLDDRRLAVVRVRPGNGERPLLEHAESVTGPHAARAGALRRLAQNGVLRDAHVTLVLSQEPARLRTDRRGALPRPRRMAGCARARAAAHVLARTRPEGRADGVPVTRVALYTLSHDATWLTL